MAITATKPVDLSKINTDELLALLAARQKEELPAIEAEIAEKEAELKGLRLSRDSSVVRTHISE